MLYVALMVVPMYVREQVQFLRLNHRIQGDPGSLLKVGLYNSNNNNLLLHNNKRDRVSSRSNQHLYNNRDQFNNNSNRAQDLDNSNNILDNNNNNNILGNNNNILDSNKDLHNNNNTRANSKITTFLVNSVTNSSRFRQNRSRTPNVQVL